MSDNNFFVISGDDAGNIWVNDHKRFDASEPGIRELSIGSVQPPLGPNGETIWSDALKISGIRRLKVAADALDGRACKEDAVDINHTEDFELTVNMLHPGQRYCGTIKGESKTCSVTVKKQVGHAKEVDYDYGNKEDKRNGYTTGQTLNVTTEDRSTTTVRCLQADAPMLKSGPYRYVFPAPNAWYHSIAVFFFRLIY